MLKNKAEQLSMLWNENQEFTCSESWLDRWKKRHTFTVGNVIGEVKWSKICASYLPDDIFTSDKTGLFYQLTLDKTLKFKGETGVDGKLSSKQGTLWICTNVRVRGEETAAD